MDMNYGISATNSSNKLITGKPEHFLQKIEYYFCE